MSREVQGERVYLTIDASIMPVATTTQAEEPGSSGEMVLNLGDMARKTRESAQECPMEVIPEVRECRTKSQVKWLVYVPERRSPVGKLIADLDWESDYYNDAQQEGKWGSIKSLFVRKGYRGVGLGELLLKRCKAFMRREGYAFLCLDAEEDLSRFGRLVVFYKAHGFIAQPPPNDRGYRLLYNGDDQTFRVVPMICQLCRESDEITRNDDDECCETKGWD